MNIYICGSSVLLRLATNSKRNTAKCTLASLPISLPHPTSCSVRLYRDSLSCMLTIVHEIHSFLSRLLSSQHRVFKSM